MAVPASPVPALGIRQQDADAEPSSPPVTRPSWLNSWRLYGLLIAGALALGAVTLLFGSTPSYDPWAWLVWGREILLHGTLHTPGGPTWKPLPMVFTTVFAAFGHAQPNLWLVVARAGFIVACLMSGKLAFRMTRWLAVAGEAPPSAASGPRTWLPALLAGIAAVVGVALSSNFLSSSALGYSEGVAIAALLIGVERHLDGHWRQAFALGFVAALDRPEVWVLWGPYGLWLMWRDPGSRVLVVSLAVLTVALWFGPQKWGGGSFTSGVSRATHPRANSPAFAKCPFCTEFKDDAWPKVMLRTKIAAILGMLAAAGLLVRGWRPAPTPRNRAMLVLLASGIVGFAWWIGISLETQAGFSGNTRYIVIGSVFVYVCGSIAFGWAALALGELLMRVARRRPTEASGPRAGAAWATPAATAVLALIFLFGPHWVGSSLTSLPKTHKSLAYQASLRTDMVALIDSAGGPAALKSCGAGRIMVEGFQVPMAAWYLGVRTIDVLDQPTGNAGAPIVHPGRPWPNVIFQDRDTGGTSAALLPTWQQINTWTADGARYQVRTTDHMRFFEDCSAQTNDPAQVYSS